MKKLLFLVLIAACFAASPAFADEMTDLKEQIKELTQTVKSLTSTVEDLKSKDEIRQREITTLKEGSSRPGVPVGTTSPDQIQELNDKVDKVVEAQKKVLPSEFNPAIGLVGDTVYSYRSQGSEKTGSDRPGGADINVRAVELNMAASVDPFATAYAVITGSADASSGEATLGVEEAAMQSTSLPYNLTLKGGRFFGEFGRLAYIHDHELPFVNRPLVLDRYIGGESQTDGAQLSWLVPIEHYVNVTVGAGNHFGNPQENPGTYRSFNELNYFGRVSTYFDLPSDWQVETGVSGLIDPHTDDRGGALIQPDGSTLTERERRLAGVDFSLRWVPLRNNQFQSFAWGTKILYNDNRYDFDPDATPGNGDEFSHSVGAYGLYSYMAYKIDREWVTGVSFDYLENEQNQHDQTKAYSAFLTYNISHWNQLRLEYTHTDRDPISGQRDDDAVYLQWAWIIGSHSHGWQQR